jgi:hypothetical protein
MGIESFGKRESADEEAARIAEQAEVRERLREKADALWAEFGSAEAVDAMGEERAEIAQRMMEGVKALLKGDEEAAPFVGERFRRALTEAGGDDREREEEERHKRAQEVGEELRRRREGME